MKTKVAIVGAGPAGLLLARLLEIEGIESEIIECRSRDEIEQTIKAGVLEQVTVDLMNEIGAGDRMMAEGYRHEGFELRFGNSSRRIDLCGLTGGKAIMVYPQHEVIRDLVALRIATAGRIHFEVDRVRLVDIDSGAPRIEFTDSGGQPRAIECDFIAGCDGTQGVSRQAIPAGQLTVYERKYPFGWFGILCEAPPSSPELIYALGEAGFALISTRSDTVQRMYFQCDPGEDPGPWTDTAIWHELQSRVAINSGATLHEGPIFSKNVIAMRSIVTTPMQYGRLFLAGDAAHVVPPTGAKGLNLAAGDVHVLARALAQYYDHGSEQALNGYSTTALPRVWKAQRFSWWMTSMLHRFPDSDPFQYRMQLAELDYVTGSEAAATALAEQYVGLPHFPADN